MSIDCLLYSGKYGRFKLSIFIYWCHCWGLRANSKEYRKKKNKYYMYDRYSENNEWKTTTRTLYYNYHLDLVYSFIYTLSLWCYEPVVNLTDYCGFVNEVLVENLKMSCTSGLFIILYATIMIAVIITQAARSCGDVDGTWINTCPETPVLLSIHGQYGYVVST